MKTTHLIAWFFFLTSSDYAKAQDQIEKLSKIVAIQQAQIKSLLPHKSCREIKETNPKALDGEYLIALSPSNPPAMVHCDMTNGGWTQIAAFDGTVVIMAANYIDGLASLRSPNYALPCNSFDSITKGRDVTMRINMGEIRDYFKPIAGADFCQMLTESPSSKFKWSATPEGSYIQPSYYGAHMGGSRLDWPKENVPNDSRRHLSFWGPGSDTWLGGCCHYKKDDASNWARAFEVYIR